MPTHRDDYEKEATVPIMSSIVEESKDLNISFDKHGEESKFLSKASLKDFMSAENGNSPFYESFFN